MAELHPNEAKLADALKGQTAVTPDPADPNKSHAATDDLNAEQVAEQTRRAAEARPDGVEDRKDKMVDIGRGGQTAGRQ